MKRRTFLECSGSAATGISSGALLSMLCACNQNNPVKQQPNIVIIALDDAGWNDFSYHNSEIETPAIDRLAHEGVELDQFYAYPVCSPTRAALMTGSPPGRIGVVTAVTAQHEEPMLPPGTVTIAELLRRHGYATAITGKWHLGNTLQLSPDNYGFDHAHGFLGPWVDFYTHLSQENKVSWHRNGKYIEQEGHATDLIMDEAIRFITGIRDKTKPFFLYVPFNAPHLPLQEESRWIEPYNGIIESESRRYYAAAMSHADHAIGQIISTLESEGIEKETLVIFFSDNGGEPPGKKNYLRPVPTYKTTTAIDKYGDNTPLRGAKYSLYEGGIRVAACMYWPDHIEPGMVSEPMIVYDIYPTIAHISGISIPEEVNIEGWNVWPAVTGESMQGERILYWRSGNQLAVRRGNWKLIHRGKTLESGKDELYNIAEDPFEQTDHSSTNREKLNELRKEMINQLSRDK